MPPKQLSDDEIQTGRELREHGFGQATRNTLDIDRAHKLLDAAERMRYEQQLDVKVEEILSNYKTR